MTDLSHDEVNTALDIAMKAKDLDMIKLALRQGANVETLFVAGVENSNLTWVKTAVEHGADVETKIKKSQDIWTGTGTKTVDHFIPAFMRAFQKSSENRTLIDIFRTPMYTNIAEYLLEKGADINAADDQGNNALFFAIETAKSEKRILFLLARNADPLAQNAQGVTALRVLEQSFSFNAGPKKDLLKRILQIIEDKKLSANSMEKAELDHSIAVPDRIKLKPPAPLQKGTP